MRTEGCAAVPKFPYMPLYVDDYLSATTELSTLEHGSYLLLLFAAWKRPGCDLPDDDVKLARVVKQPLGVWTKRLRPVLEPSFSRSRTAFGARGGRARYAPTSSMSARSAAVPRRRGTRRRLPDLPAGGPATARLLSH
jgi:uncharacterized protein YdaU (DUF1376 family)